MVAFSADAPAPPSSRDAFTLAHHRTTPSTEMSSFTVSAGLATYTGFRAAPQVRRAPSPAAEAANASWPFQGLRVLALDARRSRETRSR